MRKKFIRSILALCMCASAATVANAQSFTRLDVPGSWSLGTTIGMSDLWGDVGTESVIDHYNNSTYPKHLHFMGGLFGRFTVVPAFSIRLSVNYGTLYANDQFNYDKAKKAKSIDDDAVQRYIRFQDAKTNIWEGNLMFEFEPLRFNPELNKAARRAAQPYIFAGIGVFHYTPYSSLNGKWIKTHDLHLEGQGLNVPGFPAKDNLTQLCVPLGLGYRFDIGEHLNLGIEYCYRLTFTDYLDGVSSKYIDPKYFDLTLDPDKAAIAKQLADKSNLAVFDGHNAPGNMRGNPSNNDSYSTISIIFYYKVKPHRVPWWAE